MLEIEQSLAAIGAGFAIAAIGQIERKQHLKIAEDIQHPDRLTSFVNPFDPPDTRYMEQVCRIAKLALTRKEAHVGAPCKGIVFENPECFEAFSYGVEPACAVGDIGWRIIRGLFDESAGKLPVL